MGLELLCLVEKKYYNAFYRYGDTGEGGSDGCKTAFKNPGATSGHAYLSTTMRDHGFFSL